MASSRLPGKVLREVQGEPMLAKIIRRLRTAESLDRVLVATTDSSADNQIADWASTFGVDIFRGDEFNVLKRFADAAKSDPDATVIVRVTADCPFVDPAIVDMLVSDVESGADYASNRLPPPYPRTYPVGLDVEAFTAVALRRAKAEATEWHQLEHVTPYMYENRERFRVVVRELERNLSSYRWTVDTQDDLDVVNALAELLGEEPYGWERVLQAAVANPEIGLVNQTHTQKNLREIDSRWRERPL